MINSSKAASSLARYAASGLEKDFTEVVREMGAYVWAVAMRRLGDAQLAEEAAQNVFVILAIKADTLSGKNGLLAWLHRAAILEASNLARAKMRRGRSLRDLEEEQACRTPPFSESPSSVGELSEVGAELDEALNRLPASDKEVLLARYYEGLSFRELAARLARSEEALKKQTQRALEKMRRHMRTKSGSSMTAGMLGGMLEAQSAETVLSSSQISALVQSTMRTVASSGGTSFLGSVWLGSIISFLQSSKMAVISACVLVVMLVAVDWQYRRVFSLKSEVDSLGTQSSRTSERGNEAQHVTKGLGKPWEDATPPDPLTGEALIRAVIRGSQRGLYDPGYRFAALSLEGLPEEEWRRLLAEIDASDRPARSRHTAAWLLLQSVGLTRKQFVVEELARRGSYNELEFSMKQWAMREPMEAWDWLEKAMMEEALKVKGGSSLRDAERTTRGGFAAGLSASRSPADVASFVRSKEMSVVYPQLVADVVGEYLSKIGGRENIEPMMDFLAELNTSSHVIADALSQHFEKLYQAGDPIDESIQKVTRLLEHPAFPSSEKSRVLRNGFLWLPEGSNHVFGAFIVVHECSPEQDKADNLAWLAVELDKKNPWIKQESFSRVRLHLRRGGENLETLWNRASEATAMALAERGQVEMAREYTRKITEESRQWHVQEMIQSLHSTSPAR